MNNSIFDCIYLRKSRTDPDYQTGDKQQTLSRHESQLLELANRNGCNIRSIYKEVVSGDTISDRPVIQQLLREVSRGQWRSVLVMDLDRLARGNTADQGRIMECFQYSGTRIITPLKTYDLKNEYDEEYMEFGLFLSRREYRIINRRIQRGRLQSAKEGKYIGNRPPYGYLREKISGEKGWTLIPHPQEASIVKEIFQSYYGVEISKTADNTLISGSTVTPLSVREITLKLNRAGIPSANNKPWTTSGIYSILKNPVYAGYIKHGARPRLKVKHPENVEIHRPFVSTCPLYPGRHQPLVPEQLFFRHPAFRDRRIGSS